jgi:hypothetical protein
MIVNSGRQQLARQAAGLAAPEKFVFHLLFNFPTITPTTTLADLTEAAWVGYAPWPVPLGGWGAPAIDGAGRAVSTASLAARFSNTSGFPQSASGWFMTGQTSGVLYAAELYAPGILLENGETVSLWPTLLVTDLP